MKQMRSEQLYQLTDECRQKMQDLYSDEQIAEIIDNMGVDAVNEMYDGKRFEINYGIASIHGILRAINPKKNWLIVWKKMDDEAMSALTDWQREYHRIRKNQEYFLIYNDEGCLLYALNVSAESTLCSLSNLMKLLADKF